MAEVSVTVYLNDVFQKCQLDLTLRNDTVKVLRTGLAAAYPLATDIQVTSISCRPCPLRAQIFSQACAFLML